MRKAPCTLLSIFLLLFSGNMLAQDNSMEQRIGWRSDVELHSFTDALKELSCTIVAKEDSIRVFVTDDQLQIVQQFRVLRFPKERILGGYFRHGQVLLFAEYDGYDELYKREMNIATGKVTDKWFSFAQKKADVVGQISGGDRFLYFTVDKKKSQFIISDFNEDDTCTEFRYNFDPGVWRDLTNGGLFKRSIDVASVDVEGECNLEIAIRKNKLYLHNDNLFLVMNNQPDSTLVFNFDLRSKKVGSRIIQHGNGSRATGATEYNSFVLHGKLYYVRATYDILRLEIADLFSGTVLKTFAAGKADTIQFKNTPIIQEDEDIGSNTARESEKTAQLLRKMVNGKIVVTATPADNNQVQLMIGSYAKFKVIDNKDMPLNWDMGFVNTIGMFSRNTYTKSVRFKTLLNENTFEHVIGKTSRSINEKIGNFADEFKKPPKAENLYKVKGRYYYAFYDRTDYRLVIMEF